MKKDHHSGGMSRAVRTAYRTRLTAIVVITAQILGVLTGCGQQQEQNGSAVQQTGETKVLSQALYPELPEQPSEGGDTQFDDDWEKQYDAYQDALAELKKDTVEESYLKELSGFTVSSIAELMTDTTKNVVYSPANLYLALAMLTETTQGNSQQQLLQLIGVDDTQVLREQTSRIWKTLYQDNAYGKTVLANSLWLNEDIPFHQDTLDVLAQDYYASSYQVKMGTADTDQAIAAWINENTGDLLSDAAQNIETDPSTVLALYSTLYFYDQWAEEFPEGETKPDTFFLADGTEQTVDFMHLTESDDFVVADGYTLAQLELKGRGSMIIVLPDEDTNLDDILSDSNTMQEIMTGTDSAQARAGEVVWSVPKFDVTSTLTLSDSLKALGVTDVFDSQRADFSNLTDQDGVFVSSASQSVRTKIDEKGCTAAAFTEISVAASAWIEDTDRCEMNLNRPFLFLITGLDNLPLFVGVVNQPTA